MLSPPLGIHEVGEWSEWNAVDNSRQDESGASYAPHDSKGQSSARSALGSRWPTAGGLGMACPYPERPCRTLQPEEAAHESAEAFQGAAFCALHSAPHFSYPLGCLRLRRVDSGEDRGAQLHCHLR